MKGKLCAPAPAQPRHANIHSTLPPCTERTAQYSDYTCSRWYIRINCYKYSEHNWYEPAKNEIELKTVFRARSFHFNISRSGVFFMNFSAFVLVIRWFGDSVVSYLLLLIFRATNLPKQILFIGHNYIYICIYILRFECFVHRRWQQRRPCVVQRRDSYWKHQNKMFPSPDVISFSAVLVCECFFFRLCILFVVRFSSRNWYRQLCALFSLVRKTTRNARTLFRPHLLWNYWMLACDLLSIANV